VIQLFWSGSTILECGGYFAGAVAILECGGKALRDTALDVFQFVESDRYQCKAVSQSLPPHSKIATTLQRSLAFVAYYTA
jgi:hypothetical protein